MSGLKGSVQVSDVACRCWIVRKHVWGGSLVSRRMKLWGLNAKKKDLGKVPVVLSICNSCGQQLAVSLWTELYWSRKFIMLMVDNVWRFTTCFYQLCIDATYYYICCMGCVCLCSLHGELCKNGWADRDAVWDVDSILLTGKWHTAVCPAKGPFTVGWCRLYLIHGSLGSRLWGRKNHVLDRACVTPQERTLL